MKLNIYCSTVALCLYTTTVVGVSAEYSYLQGRTPLIGDDVAPAAANDGTYSGGAVAARRGGGRGRGRTRGGGGRIKRREVYEMMEELLARDYDEGEWDVI